ncbi:MAG: Asp-tRNA(Asn)/Glu-tRNA(Gln) amidotransferase subunit GatB [Planctomycetota bacterium]|jgi:aspartyl-tRNA(Asn)/glutamyl-tRNA(Gln) amidotransferase subunit B|nr:Asp-tRNA(Asn)/Glu-tRNA(Gln) amidotransferase subunit GatB [Planctomycetota bacterium]
MKYECVIGLEVHVQLATATKLFCACPNHFTREPNVNVCPVCLGLPGSLPTINAEALRLGVKAALALDAEIPPVMKFARKHYYYPDLPKGIQISQYEEPVAVRGALEINDSGEKRRIRITRAHFEEDAGKLIHSSAVSNVDLNRTGTPLLEIVSEPDLRSPREARLYLEMLRTILLYAAVSDCNMEEGSLRCDANISVREFGDARLGVKNEIKNMNSFRAVENSLTLVYEELCRQKADREDIRQVTWGYSLDTGKIFPMRVKEDANDYRYFPEPDLPPLSLSRGMIDEIRAALPELPAAKEARFQREYNLTAYETGILVADRHLADYYEAVATAANAPKEAANWVINEVARTLNESGLTIKDFPLAPAQLADLIGDVRDKKINQPTAKKVFQMIIDGDKREVAAIVAQDNLAQVNDTGAIAAALAAAEAKNPAAAAEVRGGKTPTAMWFVGQIMGQLKGQGDPAAVTQIVAAHFGLPPEALAKKKK